MVPSPRVSEAERVQLEDLAYEIRRLTVEMVAYAQWGHIAGSLSMAEILALLYGRELVVDPENPNWPGRDRLVLSKAHTSPGLYAALALRGFFPIDALYEYCDIDGILEGHSDVVATPGLETSGGLLGMGLSVAQGMAIGLRMSGDTRARVYCILGDGEMNEGNIWEAMGSASHYKLDNLIAVLDYNRIMAKASVANQMNIEPIADRFRAFGWDVIDVDGHDIDALAQALYDARWILPAGRPVVIIARTVKGRGVAVAENSSRWHTHAPNPQTADGMLLELATAYDRPYVAYSKSSEPVKKEAFPGD